MCFFFHVVLYDFQYSYIHLGNPSTSQNILGNNHDYLRIILERILTINI
jgi:hypothetical protein